MAHNRITITFEPCTPTPSNGYNVRYRPQGSGITYRDGGNGSDSPIIIDDINDADGTEYEGYVRGDCGGGNYGPSSYFTTG
jgi:hypothetical protein